MQEKPRQLCDDDLLIVSGGVEPSVIQEFVKGPNMICTGDEPSSFCDAQVAIFHL